jgi:hypothetical protein
MRLELTVTAHIGTSGRSYVSNAKFFLSRTLPNGSEIDAKLFSYNHVTASTLSLPLSPAMTLLAIFLPLTASAIAIYFPHLIRTATGSELRRRLLPVALQAAQLIFTTVLATFFLGNAIPSSARSCLLSTQWQELYSRHDGEAIRRIQDALNCCGFRTVKDRSWPFPSEGQLVNCAVQFGRTTPCAAPWTTALQATSGLEFGVVLGVGFLQVSCVDLDESARSHRG